MKKGKLPLWIFLYILGILLLAIVINIAMGFSIPSADKSLDGPSWLDFWGGYLGGAIGCLPALAALYDNRREARSQHEESEKSRRLAALPVIACEDSFVRLYSAQLDAFFDLSGMVLLNQDKGLHEVFSSHDPGEYAEKANQLDASYSGFICLTFHNIGHGPALNVSVACLNISQDGAIPLNSIGSNESKSLMLAVQIPPDADEHYLVQYHIGIFFNDIFGNRYVQVQPLFCRKTKHSLEKISVPELIKE